MKQKLIKFLKENINPQIEIDKLLEKPKLASQGDFALPMFILSRELKKAPQEIAKNFEDKLSKTLPDFLEKIVATGPYLNFYLNNEQLTKDVLQSITKGSIFKIKTETPQKVLIEYPSPNTNKALHVGHVRNLLLGNSISNIFDKVGNKVIKANMNNDRGIAICKAMLAYKLFGEGKTPQSENIKPDKFVGNFYVLFGQKNKENPELKLEEQAQEMLAKWEQEDSETRKLWKKMMNWVFEGYSQTYKKFKYNCEKEYFESEIYDKGKEIVQKALKDKTKGFKVDDENGAIYVDLEDKKLGKKYLLRGDETTLYMTQDLYLATLKQKDYKANKYVFIVGAEQKYHFEVLFEILERLGFSGLSTNYHYAYGMLYDKNGKPFSSRKGNAADADDLIDFVEEAALNNLNEKSPNLIQKEKEKRKQIIGYAALTFGILKINPMDNYNFDIEKALSFEGETGPYVQYTYARIKSILRKIDYKTNLKIDYNLFGEKEITLIKTLKEYPEVVLEAANKYKPSSVANYLIKICQQFNEFYQNYPILKEKDDIKNARLLLCEATSKVICDALELLDIDVLEEM